MKVKIHYSISQHEDYFSIEAESLKKIREMAKLEMKKRNLNTKKNNMWSELIK